MVRKLIKHELIAYIRTVWPVTIAAIALTLLTALTAPSKMIVLVSVLWMMLMLVVVYGSIGILLGTIGRRFQRTMFSGEGYMTFSLPATPSQLIIAKLIAAVVLWIYTALLFVLCIFLFALSVSALQMGGSIAAWLKGFYSFFALFAKDPLMTVEMILLLLAVAVFTNLFIFTGISFGQMFKARKTLISAMFFIFILFFFVIVQPYVAVIYRLLYEWNVYLRYLVYIVILSALSLICFFATRYIITHKLNLSA